MLRIGVACSAGLGDVSWIDTRTRVLGFENSVDAVTIRTGRNLGVALLESLSVPAGPVFSLLIHANIRPEPSHVGRIGMTLAAERGDLALFGNTHERTGCVILVHTRHEIISERRIRITAVAVVTGKFGGCVNVVLIVPDDLGGLVPHEVRIRVADGAGCFASRLRLRLHGYP